jgi:hypothetical protein
VAEIEKKRWAVYQVWRQWARATEWTLTSHTLKARTDEEAQSRLRRMFSGGGFTSMSLVALPEGKTPNEALL